MFSFKSLAFVAAILASAQSSGVPVAAVAAVPAPLAIGYAHGIPPSGPPFSSQINLFNRAVNPLVPAVAPVPTPFGAPVPVPFRSAIAPLPSFTPSPFFGPSPYAGPEQFVASPYAYPPFGNPLPYAPYSSPLLRTPFGLAPTFVR